MFKTSKNYTIYEIKLLKIIKEASNTYTYVFTKPKDLTWVEGAHTHLALNEFNEEIGWWDKKNVRHFSIMSLESENVICLTTRLPKKHTDFKEKLLKAKKDDVFYLFKVGSLLQLRRENKEVVMITAGVGIASIRPLVKAFILDAKGISKVQHLNIDSSCDFIFKDEFEKYSKEQPLFINQYVSNRGEFYRELHKIMANQVLDERFFYVIGSDEFLMAVREVLKSYNISDQRLILDKKEEFYQLLNEKIS